jgi:MtN3 and saliva related transmembrane protein
MSFTEIIGFGAAVLTTGSFIPQAIQVIKTKDTTSISLSMYILFSLGVVLWLIYGFFINNMPMIIANTVTVCLASIILYYKLTEKKRANKS